MILPTSQSTSGQVDPKLQSPINVMQRELTGAERKAIHKLVKSDCANYCSDNGCLILNDNCPMLIKYWTGAYCKYFRSAVLPLDPILQSALNDNYIKIRICSICSAEFPVNGKQKYCSDACSGEAQRKRNMVFMRKNRSS